MPIEGFPEAKKHKHCIRCQLWHYPEEGTLIIPESSGPLASLRAMRENIAGSESLYRFMCFRCQNVRKWQKRIIYDTFLVVFFTIIILEALGVIEQLLYCALQKYGKQFPNHATRPYFAGHWRSVRRSRNPKVSMVTSKQINTTCPRCSTTLEIDKNRSFLIRNKTHFTWFYDAMNQFENFSTVKCPECGNVFKAPEARLFGVFKSPYTLVILATLLGIMLIFLDYLFFIKKN